MHISMTDECYIFLYSCLSGALICFFYDLVFLALRQKKCSLFVLNICDGICVIVACAIMLFVTFSVSQGIVRAYEFFGALLGAVFYKLTLSRLFCFILCKMIDGILIFFKVFLKILLTPLKFMYKMINKCIKGLLCPIVRPVKKLFRLLWFRLKSNVHITRKAMRKT